MMSAPILITADEVNCLVYSYLQDSGFNHAAFSLKAEGVLEASPHFTKHIPRGELVDLLCKALLYIEVESHWKGGDSMTATCKSGFSLLGPHVCSVVAKVTPSPSYIPAVYPEGQLNVGSTESVKRKASSTPSTDDGRSDKRARTEPEEAEANANAVTLTTETKTKTKESKPTNMSVPPVIAPPGEVSKKSRQPKRLRGPADDSTDPEAVRLLQGHKTEVFVCAWNPTRPGIIATGSKDAMVYIWNLPSPPKDGSGFAPPHTETPLALNHFNNSQEGDLTSLDWNVDGSLLAVGSYDSILRICTVEGGLYFSNPQHQGPIFATRFSKSGRWLLTASLDGTACVWDVKGKKLHMQYRCHTDCCLDVDWLDENTFASCGADALIHIMKIDSTNPIKTLSGHVNEINQIKSNPSRTRLASCSDDQTTRIWNVANVSSANSPESIPGLVASDQIVILKGHKHVVSSVTWCPHLARGSNELVATSSFDGTTRLWDSITGECFKVFSDHKRPVYALSFSPDGHWLASGSGDGWLHIYNVKAKEKRWSWYAGHERPGVFEIDWQKSGNINRIALALECRQVGIVDVTRISALQ